jgi:hypothetical protein
MNSIIVWTISDIIDLTVGILLVLFYAAINIALLFKQKNCKHEKFNETSSCDAICQSCGKNLGFIGNVRRDKS